MVKNLKPTGTAMPEPTVIQPADIPVDAFPAVPAGGLFNIFWVCLLVITQLVAIAFATDWAIISLLNLPFALTCVLAVVTAAAVVYGSWFVIKAAVQAERSQAGPA